MLRLEKISTHYGGVPMLRKVSLQMEKRELVCLLGSNGAGKTTTLKAILKLVPMTEGSIFFRENRSITGKHIKSSMQGSASFQKGDGSFQR
jgi:branched-chain amino acid transport system ATP-binding protein